MKSEALWTRYQWVALVVSAVLGAALLGAASAHAGDAPCSPSPFSLEDPDDWYVVRDVNASLQVAGQVAGGGPPVIWDHNGDARDIDVPFGDVDVKAINAVGDITGDGYLPDRDPEVSWIYTAARDLIVLRATRPGAAAIARDINNERVVVGRQDGLPIIWRDPLERAEWLEVPPRTVSGEAVGVGPSGRAQGYVVTPQGQFHIKWSPAGEIRSRQAVPNGFFTQAYALHGFEGSYAIGQIDNGSEKLPGLLGPDGLIPIELPDDVIWGQAYSVSRSGYAAGTIQWSDGRQEGFLSEPTGEMHSLTESTAALAIIDANELTMIDIGRSAGSRQQVHACASAYLE